MFIEIPVSYVKPEIFQYTNAQGKSKLNFVFFISPNQLFFSQSQNLRCFYVCFSNLGYEIYGMLFKPHNWNSRKKYPTMLYVYGGPGVQVFISLVLFPPPFN